MQATIVLINTIRGMIAAQTDEGEFVIFELLGDYEVEPGHNVMHNDFTSMGHEMYRNITTNKNMDVYVQNLCATLKQAREQCLF